MVIVGDGIPASQALAATSTRLTLSSHGRAHAPHIGERTTLAPQLRMQKPLYSNRTPGSATHTKQQRYCAVYTIMCLCFTTSLKLAAQYLAYSVRRHPHVASSPRHLRTSAELRFVPCGAKCSAAKHPAC